MDGERIQISAEESGERIDALLARIFPALSRSLIQKCMEQGAVTLNGRPAKKNARAAEGDLVDFVLPSIGRSCPVYGRARRWRGARFLPPCAVWSRNMSIPATPRRSA